MFSFSQLKLPIIQAPMAGGLNTPQLASAVANAGGVGSFGFAYSPPQKISEDLAATKSLTQGPINANFFIFRPVALPSATLQQQAIDALKKLSLLGEYAVSIPQAPYFPNLEDQLGPLWEHPPEIITFHFGIPSAGIIERAHSLGMAIGMTATNADEAQTIQKAGADFIVAQGIEAGGHRGIFEPASFDEKLSTLELTRLLVNKCSLPIVAAGGMMDGYDISQALKAGATAVQMGTAFLCCDEAGTAQSYREYLLNKQDRPTVFTKGFSGRVARGIENEFIRLIENQAVLPFPIQNTLTGPLRQLAGKINNAEYQSLWAGAAFSKIRKTKVIELMDALSKEILLSR